ncbi:2-dehydro-3-deoxygalactonokinase [Polymorphobacter fuscus]|uniref:2-oxo-3-deoxygalactonate kinase n=1 Tax=Sandarakinorhabdus fusca TaxID=1439888 RepID=A0A7C9KMY4_9SPHN|nr:2-dehydro-3-deoxygalactonokinase [Polymorphobacter fuscus]KAB7644881.1 2-dehydro-3-deoxygalactonokinase [Polymorphobacter fuscus]MQT18163.1 2-oxo-3-deoxygalactonate kinase [Polymorphobacter fuscus]NJC09481.1 2-dehydro-3-deoxygalactonokinase [Polymorphobacter fuscus]
MTGKGFLAIDWGTTNRRVYHVLDDGRVVDRLDDAEGVAALSPEAYPAAIAALRARFGALPVLAAGMVGSTRGWREAPYVAAPAGLETIAAGLLAVGDGVAIVPGVCQADGDRPDVMRGEEVQLLGAVAAGLVPADAVLVQPGTHSKWVTMAGGRIAGWRTRMTGELFALLRDRSVLAEMMQGPVAPGPAFCEGVDRRGEDLTAALFEVRAGVLLGRRAAADGAAFASGLLIGAEIAAAGDAGAPVHLLSEGPLAALYTAAIVRLGGTAEHIDSHRAFVAGIHRLWELSR